MGLFSLFIFSLHLSYNNMEAQPAFFSEIKLSHKQLCLFSPTLHRFVVCLPLHFPSRMKSSPKSPGALPSSHSCIQQPDRNLSSLHIRESAQKLCLSVCMLPYNNYQELEENNNNNNNKIL